MDAQVTGKALIAYKNPHIWTKIVLSTWQALVLQTHTHTHTHGRIHSRRRMLTKRAEMNKRQMLTLHAHVHTGRGSA